MRRSGIWKILAAGRFMGRKDGVAAQTPCPSNLVNSLADLPRDWALLYPSGTHPTSGRAPSSRSAEGTRRTRAWQMRQLPGARDPLNLMHSTGVFVPVPPVALGGHEILACVDSGIPADSHNPPFFEPHPHGP